jgi:hypothetical protein
VGDGKKLQDKLVERSKGTRNWVKSIVHWWTTGGERELFDFAEIYNSQP